MAEQRSRKVSNVSLFSRISAQTWHDFDSESWQSVLNLGRYS